MKKTGIIGGGFTGTVLVAQLVKKASKPCEIIVINNKDTLNKGIAYNTYSNKHLLNVITGKMSAFPDKPDDFLDWVMQKPDFKEKDRTLICNSFLPRYLYGEYLTEIWTQTEELAKSKHIELIIKETSVADIQLEDKMISIELENNTHLKVDRCVIATGNQLPRNPKIKNMDFYRSKNYHQNPWSITAVKDCKPDLPILIIGNGLTMVDTVFGLLEKGFKETIYSISPNGFNILPHRHNGLKYTKLTEELKEEITLHELIRLINKHIKTTRGFGISAEPVIDSLRPHTQRIWKSFTEQEKTLFMSRLRHLWGVARHRIPLHSHDKIQQLRIDGKLHINSGRLINFEESKECIEVIYFDKKEKIEKSIKVSRVINCTGPETDLMHLENNFLNKCLLKGILVQDHLKLGIKTDTDSFRIINAEGKLHRNLFTIGSNLKGELWESTAVNEIRVQTEKLAEILTL